jgi:hypothetical protein
MNRSSLLVTGVAVIFGSSVAIAQEASARTVQYHSQDIVPIHAKLKYTTLIEVPPSEKIMEAATGDKEFWVVDVVGNFCFVHPAKAGISSNLNLITDKGNIYSFTLQDISDSSTVPDLKVLVFSRWTAHRSSPHPGLHSLCLPRSSSNRVSRLLRCRRTSLRRWTSTRARIPWL